MSKNHNQEVKSLMLKNRALSNEAEDLRNASQRLHAQLKVKYVYIRCVISVVLSKHCFTVPLKIYQS